MKIYISGPITGWPDGNTPAFMAASFALLAAGYEVVNPVHNGLPDSAEWHQHMRADIKMLMDCEGIALLDAWWLSKGARLEHDIARRLGMPSNDVAVWVAAKAAA